MTTEAFHVLADPTRYAIVESLMSQPKAVGDIVDRVGIRQSGVSRHLRILQEAGFVQVRPEGTRRVYSLRPERFDQLDAWVSRYRAAWDARLDRFGAALDAAPDNNLDDPAAKEKND